ncbi:MAG: outer membrane protein assembly factor BamD [Candidatus Binatia bacterium]
MKKTILLLSGLLLASCATQKVLPEKEYFDSGTEAMDEEAFDVAIDQYQKLLEEYPFSEYTEEAQLKIAFAQYKSERYAEAIASFQDFQRMHPTNPNLPFAEYYLAMSYKDQMGAKDRDQSASAQAHAHFQALIDRYPESPFAEKAKKQLRECRELLAEHELSVAEFYLHWGNPLGAESRLRNLLQTYPDTATTAEALLRFGNYFRKQGDLTRAALAFAALKEKYPENPLSGEAKSALARLSEKSVEADSEPLAALVETLGRPSASVQPVPPEDRPSAAAVSAGEPG